MQDQPTTRTFIPAKIGPVWLILEASDVQEIVGARAWVPVPHSSPMVPGVLAWRGRAVAVLDLSVLARAGDPLVAREQRPRTLIVSSSDCLLAMPVDAVREVQEIDASRVQQPHVTHIDHCSSEVQLFGSFAPILDLRALVGAVLEGGMSHDD